MTMPTPTPRSSTAHNAQTQREAARRLRVEAITNGALVRQALGVRAMYRKLDDGEHEIIVGAQTTVGANLDEAIRRAREQRP
jgi:hypothetical protein